MRITMVKVEPAFKSQAEKLNENLGKHSQSERPRWLSGQSVSGLTNKY